MSEMRFGFEIEGGIPRKYLNISTNCQVSALKNNLKENHTKEYARKVLSEVKIATDGTASLYNDYYQDDYEFKSAKPIPDDRVFEHLEIFTGFLKKYEFDYLPSKCGLHIHISPFGKEWEIEQLKSFLPNLFFSLAPFTRFFRERRKTHFAYSNKAFCNLGRFIMEDLQFSTSIDDLRTRFQARGGVNISEERNFEASHIIKLRQLWDLGSVETRIFPPDLDLIEVFTKLLQKIYQNKYKISHSRLTSCNIRDILKVYELGQYYQVFQNYQKRWR